MEPEAPTTPQRRAGRDWLKCTYCREGRRKCEPEDYDFSRGEKCLVCIRGKKPCGPRVPHSEHDSVLNSTPGSHTTSNPSVRHSMSFTSSTGSSGYRTASTIPPTLDPATISLGSPTHERGRARLSFSGNDAKKPSPKEVVWSKLIELGHQGDLYRYLSCRLEAVLAESPNVEPTDLQEVVNGISSICDLIIRSCNQLSADVWNMMPSVTPRAEKESAFHTFEKKLHYMISLQPPHQSLDQSTQEESSPGSHLAEPDDFGRLKCFHCQVFLQLATLYEELGDYSEALRIKEDTNRLAAKYSLAADFTEMPTGENFEHLSRGMTRAFINLEIPRRLARSLPHPRNIFPAAHLAVHRGWTAIARDIVRAGTNPGQCDILKRNILHISVEVQDKSLLELALCQNNIGQERDIFNQTALCLAASAGGLDIFVHLLSAEGQNDTSVRNICHRSILAIASGVGHDQIIQHLLENGYCSANDPRAVESNGPPSALFTAARGGYAHCVEILLAHNAWANSQWGGVMPWQIAQQGGHAAIAQRLQNAAREQEERLIASFPLPTENAGFQLPNENANFQLPNDEWTGGLTDYTGSQLDSGSGSASLLSNASGTATFATVLAPSTPIINEPQQSSPGLSCDLSRSGSVVTPSPRPAETLLTPHIDVSRKRSHPSSPHQTPYLSERSSRQSSGPSKRHQPSNC